MFGLFGKRKPQHPPTPFPPVPKWQPQISQPIDVIVDRVLYYTDRKRDFAVFRNGTCVIVPNGIPDGEAIATAKETLTKILNFHPDMKPRVMDDGNIAIQYNHPAINVVLDDIARKHWREIDNNHQDALTTDEVLMTPLGANKFDEFGKKSLFGRCLMFMDAQVLEVIRLVRASA